MLSKEAKKTFPARTAAILLCSIIASALILTFALPAFSASPLESKQSELNATKAEIDDLESEISSLENEKFTLESEISLLDLKIARAEKEIIILEAELAFLDSEITDLNVEISKDILSLARQKTLLTESFKTLYATQSKPILEILLSADGFSGFMNQIKGLTQSQEGVIKHSNQITDLKTSLETKRESASNKFQQVTATASTLATEKSSLSQNRLKQKEALSLLNQNIKTESAELTLKNFTKAQLESEIFIIINSSTNDNPVQLTFAEAAQIARRVAIATGIRPALTIAIVDQESGLKSHAGTGNWQTDMHPDHRPAFLRITAKLGLNPDEMPVSKKPTSYSGWGGAMGAAQVMPLKWEDVESEIAALSGDNPPSPWDAEDSFFGAAIILRDLGAANPSGEFEAAGRYFAGNNWQNYLWYPEQVLQKAAIYEEKLNALD